jgi:hypothetical protein
LLVVFLPVTVAPRALLSDSAAGIRRRCRRRRAILVGHGERG